MQFEDVTPNPEFLIKSIAEQGYSLESALADLMDNSISANANEIEIVIDTEKEPFTLFLSDNGDGMDELTLKKSMQFPSQSSEEYRLAEDLGRFGLGMKTASFSQTRRFSVLSRKKGLKTYQARTWDVELLKNNEWRLLVNSKSEVDKLLQRYRHISRSKLNPFHNFEANTIIVWEGLYKFEEYLEEKNRYKALKREINEVTCDHLALVFHRFMEAKNNPLKIRVNNQRLDPINPFPLSEKDFRSIEYKTRKFGTDAIKVEGYVLPSRAISEVKQGNCIWTTKNKGLMDMEGLYIYRANRIILFGGWNGLIKKAPRLQLARLRVEIGNRADHLLHLNVAKSQVIIPHELQNAFEDYISLLKQEAEREYFNRGLKKFVNKKTENKSNLLESHHTNKGVVFELNKEFVLIKKLLNDLGPKQSVNFILLIKMINITLSKFRNTHTDIEFIEDKENMTLIELVDCLNSLKNSGIDAITLRDAIIPQLGYDIKTLPPEILEIVKG